MQTLRIPSSRHLRLALCVALIALVSALLLPAISGTAQAQSAGPQPGFGGVFFAVANGSIDLAFTDVPGVPPDGGENATPVPLMSPATLTLLALALALIAWGSIRSGRFSD